MGIIRILGPEKRVKKINEHSSVSLVQGNDGVNELLAIGGVGTSSELVKFALSHLGRGYRRMKAPAEFEFRPGCTAIQVPNADGKGYLFGRNYDFEPHTMMILQVEPDDGYKSISSVDTSFITGNFGKAGKLLPMQIIKALALWLPVDGMNEKGLCFSVNMILDDVVITQDRGKPQQIIVTAARTILDKAATVDEAIKILESCDMRSWEGFFCHMAISDATGRCVAAEYIDDELIIVESPVVTNFYLKEGPKFGIGTEQSHIRYERAMAHLKEKPAMTADEMKDELAGAAKSNFPDDPHTTEWSIVYDQKKLTATYYRREDYDHPWMIML